MEQVEGGIFNHTSSIHDISRLQGYSHEKWWAKSNWHVRYFAW